MHADWQTFFSLAKLVKVLPEEKAKKRFWVHWQICCAVLPCQKLLAKGRSFMSMLAWHKGWAVGCFLAEHDQTVWTQVWTCTCLCAVGCCEWRVEVDVFFIGLTSLERGSSNIDSLKVRGWLVNRMDCNIFIKWLGISHYIWKTFTTLSTDYILQFSTDQWIKPFIKIHRQRSFHRSHNHHFWRHGSGANLDNVSTRVFSSSRSVS